MQVLLHFKIYLTPHDVLSQRLKNIWDALMNTMWEEATNVKELPGDKDPI